MITAAALAFPRLRGHVDAWAPPTYTAEGYEGVRRTATYRSDVHVLVEAPDRTMAASTIMWPGTGPLSPACQASAMCPCGGQP